MITGPTIPVRFEHGKAPVDRTLEPTGLILKAVASARFEAGLLTGEARLRLTAERLRRLRRPVPGYFQIGVPSPGNPSRSHISETRSTTSASMRISSPHSRFVSGGHLSVASSPILEPRPLSGLAKSR